MILDDNTVIPSFMGTRTRGDVEDAGDLSNVALRLGEVKAIVYPDDELSQTKRFLEYSVEVQHRDDTGPGTTVRYSGCLLNNLFGGSADVLRYTLRKDNQERTDEDGLGVGSKVLLACINGQTTRAMIIGGVRDTKVDEKTVEKKSDGHNLYFEFNGISFNVDKDGAVQLKFRGATKADGTLDTGASDQNGPTTVEIKKNGNVRVSTKDDQQFVHIDHENKKVEFLFDQEWNVKVNKKVVEDFGSSWECRTGSTISLNAGDSVTFNAGADWNMGASGNVKIKSAGTLIGAATDNMMKGSTYRTAQGTLHIGLGSGLSAVGVQLGIAGTAITAACIPLLIPVVGGLLASPLLAPAGIALASSVAMITEMVTAISTFEAAGLSYLSPSNKND